MRHPAFPYPSASGMTDQDFKRLMSEAESTIQAGIRTREAVRATRMRIHLREILAQARSAKGQRGGGCLLDKLLDAIIAGSDAPMGNIQLTDGRCLRICAHHGFKRPFLDFFAEVSAGDTACSSALRSRRSVVVDDVATSPVFSDESRAAVLDAGVFAVHSMPLGFRGTRVGVVSVHYPAPGMASAGRPVLSPHLRDIAEIAALCR